LAPSEYVQLYVAIAVVMMPLVISLELVNDLCTELGI
jgi:hypothetical protein